MRRFLEFIFLSVLAINTSSCNRDEVLTADLPEIIIEGDGVYTVRVGDEVRLAPDYRNAENATFEWVIDDVVVCQERAYVHYAEAVGSLYVTLTVTTDAGSASKEMRIDILEPDIPIVDIAMEDAKVAVGFTKLMIANVRKTDEEPHIHWYENDQQVAEGESYLFEATTVGTYTIRVVAENSAGSSEDSVTLTVVDAEELAFIYEFDKKDLHIVEGRDLLILPSKVGPNEGVTYSWEVDGVKSDATKQYFVFCSNELGTHTLRATATLWDNGGNTELKHDFTIEVLEEGKYRRERNASSSTLFHTVLEYTPAPGQFIGDMKTAGFTGNELTATDATKYAYTRLINDNWVSLGAFGGYIIVDFDHSVANHSDYDFAIRGNSFDGSSEPGVVWVMQDENGNGKADDNWYELRGSETGQPRTYQNYMVTYYRPAGAAMAVVWTDNHGEGGSIDYLASFHDQLYYYPTWITEDSYTLHGTRLEARNYDRSGNGSMWVQPAYDWGYADNYSERDCVDAVNSFDISNAIDALGQSVKLDYIDFVKVQSAVQSKSGWLGELSTEVCSIWEITE